ncbi:hypothetical protein V1264_006063 [Littorina saxatilis]|uniref:Schlafen AlbA-2 domain-containing protein n=1 Tax=Littorina saxatilis TaxID=31220 RepID=A0AAN9AY23_9CAEN
MSTKLRKVKNRQADIAFEYLLARLQQLKATDDPMQGVSCLFVLKSSFEKSPMPSVAELCFERDILATLMGILKREYHPLDKTNEIVLYSLATELMCLFSGLERSCLSPLVSRPLVNLLTHYMDVRQSFYQFSPFLAQKLHSLCHNTCFPQQRVSVVPLNKEIWKDIEHYNPDAALHGASTHLTQCSLNIRLQGQSHVYSIAKRLISDRLAWAGKPLDSSTPVKPVIGGVSELIRPDERADVMVSDEDEGGGERKDIFFLNTIGGNYFWAYVGGDAASTVQSISDLLVKELPNLKTFSPRVCDLVAVETDGGEECGAVRGRVVALGEDEVVVFAVDYGSVKKVKPEHVYQLTGSAVCLAKFDAQAKICCLAGIQAPPADEPTVELAMCTVINLTKHFVGPGHMFEEAGGLNHLYTLICSAPRNIQLQAIRLLSNLTSMSKISKAWDWTKFIRPLLGVLSGKASKDTLTQLTKKDAGDNVSRNIMVATLYALTNILYHKTMYQDVFFELQGQIIVMNLMRLFKSSVPMTRAAAGMLRAAYPGLMRSVPGKNAKLIPREGKSDEEEAGKEEGSMFQRSERVYGEQDAEEFSDEEINSIMQNLIPKSIMELEVRDDLDSDSGLDSSSYSGRAESSLSLSTPFTTNNTQPEKVKVASRTLVEPKATSEEPKPSRGACGSAEEVPGTPEKQNTPVQFVPVDGGAIFDRLKDADNFYEYNTYLPHKDDGTTHLWDAEDISRVSFDRVTELVCGMLNNEGGTIYIGLTKTGCVRGITLDRETRDCVRLGLDNVCRKPEPTISHDQIQVDYVEVGQRTSSGEMKHFDNHFVIEISVRAPRDLMYFSVGKPAVCYVRDGANNTTFSEQDVRQLVVLDEERHYLPNVRVLRQRIGQLEQELQTVENVEGAKHIQSCDTW